MLQCVACRRPTRRAWSDAPAAAPFAGNYNEPDIIPMRIHPLFPSNPLIEKSSSAIAMGPLVASLCFIPFLANGQAAEQGEELVELLRQIESIEQGLERDLQAKGLEQAGLREAETRIMRLREETAAIERRLEGSRQRQSRLTADLQNKEQARQRARAALASAVRHAWRLGQVDNLKALLSGESSGEVDRRLVWTGMLARSWSRRAGQAARLEAETRALHAEAGSVERELGELQLRRAEQIRYLENAAARRRETLEALNRQIGAAGEEFQRLQNRAATLESLVGNLGDVVQQHPTPSLPSITAAHGQLVWPVKGRVLQRFGAGPGDGKARWDGVLLEAEEGASVRAPHAGRVVFADWVRGLGFLMVLDHGEQVLSLYAYNDRLLGKKGELVSKGQVIAHAGSTGGRREPGLYFEIRQNGKPVDPVQWLSK